MERARSRRSQHCGKRSRPGWISMTHDMPPDEFRRFGYETIDWIADFLANTRAYRVLPDIQPGALTDALPPAGPERGEPMEALLRDFRDQIVPATTIWNHPR